ncbi:hypothetical protein F441_09227, partial [Phytophthora nicotianae CJ01A1]
MNEMIVLDEFEHSPNIVGVSVHSIEMAVTSRALFKMFGERFVIK